jgi:hypothetical protein
MGDQIHIKAKSNTYLEDDYSIQLNTYNLHYVYGYGVGLSNNFNMNNGVDPYSLVADPSLNYFNVLKIDGNGVGFGLSGTNSNQFTSNGKVYNYGWGYEQTDVMMSDKNDSIRLRAYVYNNGVLINDTKGIKVLFEAEPGIKFSKVCVPVNSSGYAETIISLDLNEKRNIDELGNNTYLVDRLRSGFFEVNATILDVPGEISTRVNIDTKSDFLFGEDVVSYLSISTKSYSYTYGSL